jgi:hypothetical protein
VHNVCALRQVWRCAPKRAPLYSRPLNAARCPRCPHRCTKHAVALDEAIRRFNKTQSPENNGIDGLRVIAHRYHNAAEGKDSVFIRNIQLD